MDIILISYFSPTAVSSPLFVKKAFIPSPSSNTQVGGTTIKLTDSNKYNKNYDCKLL